MEKLPMCRICLAENVCMYIVVNKNLHALYERLTDIPFVTEDSRPILTCFFCCAKLKQCYRLLRQCLDAEELFAQMMNDDYEPNPIVNQDHLEFCNGFIKSPIVHISIDDECQTESIGINEELPAVCEGLDDVIEPKVELQCDGLELENLDRSLDVADTPPLRYESDFEDDVPLMEIKTEVKVEEVSENKQRAKETRRLELDNLDNSCPDVADTPPHHSESHLEDDVPLMEIKTEVKEVSKKKRRAQETKRATDAKKTKLNTRRSKLERLPDTDLTVTLMRQSDVPTLVRASLFVPRYKGGIARLQSILIRQNTWYDIGKWSLYGATTVGGDKYGTYLILGVPPEEAERVLARERRISFLLGSINVHFWPTTQPPDTATQTDNTTDLTVTLPTSTDTLDLEEVMARAAMADEYEAIPPSSPGWNEQLLASSPGYRHDDQHRVEVVEGLSDGSNSD